MIKDKPKVYFAMAAVQDQERVEVYQGVRQALLNLGCDLTYDWLSDDKKYSPKELFARTSQAINLSDLVVADVTFPSTGVGQQIAQANAKKIPVIAMKANWKQPSRFTPGAEGDLLRYVEYSRENIEKVLKDSLKRMGKERFVKFNLISTPELNDLLEKESEKIGESRSQLLRRIIRQWLEKNS